ncbi:extracellular solute-binding protein [Andreprevotia sp. IGB-42]|uniref:extracellular solute-binding protein n=1 Tax=Andreprevotia sp. IGB-42 TaxID=2497473 RepID=UPI00135840C1|nr:extracellular solute-binding protein [Andreprevotia sp. IGB-42]
MKKNAVLAAILTACAALAAQAETVTVYSSRNEQLIKPLFDAYTKETGVEIRVLTGQDGPLLERLKAEGANTPADMLITVDAGNLWRATSLGILKATQSKAIEEHIPVHLRDPEGHWYGLSVRARTIFYSPARVKPADLSTYEDLADPRWKGRLCLRTSKSVYNQSLVGMMIAQYGEAKTEKMVRGWVANLATNPFPDDTKMLEALAAGQCDVAVANSYYFGRLVAAKPDFPVKLFWANQNAEGTHVNVSGAGVTRYARNEKGALKLIEWLASDKAQKMYADKDMEFPANPKIKPNDVVLGWGTFRPNVINVSKAGELQGKAVQLMDRAGYK